MKKNLLITPSSNYFSLLINSSFTKYFCLLLLLLTGISGNAQVGPYARFESVPTSLASMTGFFFSGPTPAFARISTNTRSGGSCLQSSSSTTGAYFETPSITRLKTFSFYIRKVTGTTNQMSFKVEFYDGSTFTNASAYPGVVVNSLAALPNTTASPSPYQLVSFTFPSSIPVGKIRVTDTRVGGVAGAIVIDDIAWDCYNVDSFGAIDNTNTGYPANTVVAPIQLGVGTPTPNAGGTVSVASNAVYNFYDNGGESDNYNSSQTNVVTFTPVNGGAGEKARVTFSSFTSSTSDYIEVFNGPTAGATGTGVLYQTTSGTPVPPSYTSTATNGELTVRFVSDATATNSSGFYILADISPCAVISSASIGSINPTDATLTWSAASPVPANYDIYYNNTGIAPTGGTSPNLTVSGASTSQLLSSLSSNTQYYVWVRTKCSSTNFGTWLAITGNSFTTPCSAANVSYIQDFSTATVPSMPVCNTALSTNGTTGVWASYNVSPANYGFSGNVARFSHGSGTADAWYITQGINLVSTKTYRVTFTYSNTTSSTENLKVAYGTNNTAAAMTTTLATFSSITVGSATTYWYDFSPASNGVYYVGFQSYGPSSPGWILLDDVSVVETTCYAPSFSSFSATLVTPSTATLNWSVPSSGTPTSYQYYISPINVAPNFYTTPTGTAASGTSIAITGLSPSTTYFYWLRSNCGSGNFSSWSGALNPGTFTTGTVTNISMSNTTITNCGVNYYDSAGSGGNYANNENFTQTFVPATTNSKIKVVFNSFATESRYDFLKIYDGPTTASPLLGSYSGTQIAAGQTFVSTATNGELTFNFTSDFNNRAAGWDATVTCVTVPKIVSFSPNSICTSASNTTVTLTGQNFTGVTSVLFNTTSVSFTVVNDTTISAIVPASVTTGVITIANSQATTYSSSSFVVNPLPTALTISPASASMCQTDPALLLTATGGIVPNIAVINENFNGAAVGWTKTNASTGGTTTAPAWTLRPDAFNPGGTSGISIMHSNDNSQFYLSNSDAQGSGSNTDVTLLSPVFSLVGFTQASVSFYHYYKAWINGSAAVEIYNGSAWVSLQSWGTSGPPDNTQGTATNFKYQSYNLSPYLGMSNLQIRFRYVASWGYVWGIDNFIVSGSTGTGVTWSSVAPGSPTYPQYPGLYTNSGATTAYSGGVGSTVYALPATTTTYYVTSTSVANCSTTTTVPITVTPIAPGVASSDQSICGGAPSDLILTGSSGTIQWEYADNFGFTLGVTTISGANAATLTSAQMGVLTANRFYRAKITNGSCTAYSNIISIATSSSTTTWNGSSWSNGNPSISKAVVFNGPYTSDPATNSVSPGSISACNVFITSLGSVTFITGHTLTVQQSINVDSANGASITFEDGSSLYQPNPATNAANVYSGGNSGKITYKRVANPMYKFDYTYWTSPVYPQNLLAFSSSTPLFYEYDGLAATPHWQGVTASTTTMGVGKGYLVRAPSYFPVYVTPLTPLPAYFPGSFQGVPNNGTLSIQIGVAQGINQFNLLGNPYPSSLFADDFITANANVGALYFWTHNTNINATTLQYTNDDYAIYTLMGGTGTQASGVDGAGQNAIPNGYIASGQGFFTKGAATITGAGPNYYATFTNSMRRGTNNTQFFRTTAAAQNVSSSDKNRYWLNISNTEGAFKQSLIGYIETATMGIDRLFDAQTVDLGVVSLYTLVDNEKMAIQGRPMPFNIDDTIPLCYKSTIASTYTIALPKFEGLFTNQNIYLEDKVLNVIHNLKTSPYEFTTDIGTFENRFLLRYTTETLGVSTPVFNENSVVVYKNEQGLFINTGTESMKAVTIYDIRGRVIASKSKVDSMSTLFTALPTTQQVLLVRIEGEHGGVVTKKVVY